MTVSSIEPVNNYTGNSSNTRFDFDFLIENESELVVQHTNSEGQITILQNGIDYSIHEIKNKNGSYITFPIFGSSYGVLTEDEKLSLMLDLVIKQEKEIRNSLFFDFDTLEWMFDYVVRILQILSRKIGRCVKVKEGSVESADELLESINQAQINAKSYADSALNSEQAALEHKTGAQTIYNNVSDIYTNVQNLETQAVSEISEGRTNIASDLSSALQEMDEKAEEINRQYLYLANNSFTNLTSDGYAKFEYAPFSINNGTVDSNGNNATLQTVGDVPVSVDKYVVPQLSSNTSDYGTCNDYTMTGTKSDSFSSFTNPWTIQLAENNYIPSGATVTFTISTNNSLYNYTEGYHYYAKGCTGCTITYTYTDDTTENIFSENNTGNFASWSPQSGAKTATITLPVASKTVKAISVQGYKSTGHDYNYYNAWGITFRAQYTVSSADTLICNPCTITTADGRTKTFEYDNTLDCSNLTNGVHRILKGYSDGDLKAFYTTWLTISKTAPVNPPLYQLWLDTSKYPLELKIYYENEWHIYNNYVYIGDVTVSNGVITEVKNNYFNACPARRDLVDSYINGTSWYSVYSDGWCEQGGQISLPSSSSGTYSVSLLQAYANTNYSIVCWSISRYNASTPSYISSTKSTNQFTGSYSGTGSSSGSGSSKLDWVSFGYIA